MIRKGTRGRPSFRDAVQMLRTICSCSNADQWFIVIFIVPVEEEERKEKKMGSVLKLPIVLRIETLAMRK